MQQLSWNRGTRVLVESMEKSFKKELRKSSIDGNEKQAVFPMWRSTIDHVSSLTHIKEMKYSDRIWKKKIKRNFQLNVEEQAAFRLGRSTIDHIFSLTHIIEKMSTWPKNIRIISGTNIWYCSSDTTLAGVTNLKIDQNSLQSYLQKLKQNVKEH